MNILEKARCQQDANVRYSDFVPCVSTGIERMPSNEPDTRTKYRLDLTVAAHFWANAAELTEARKNAELGLVHFLYDNIEGKLYSLKSAIFAGDSRAALSIADAILKEIGCQS